MWAVLAEVAVYAYNEVKKGEAMRSKHRDLFVPGEAPLEDLPIYLNQWVEDESSPSGWSYRAHDGVLFIPRAFDKFEKTYGVKPADLYEYQSDAFKLKHPPYTYQRVQYDSTLSASLAYLDEGELIWMPPQACEVADKEAKVFKAEIDIANDSSDWWKHLLAVAVLGGAGYATWHYWPNIRRTARRVF